MLAQHNAGWDWISQSPQSISLTGKRCLPSLPPPFFGTSSRTFKFRTIVHLQRSETSAQEGFRNPFPGQNGSGYFQTKAARRDLRKYISPGSHQILAICCAQQTGMLIMVVEALLIAIYLGNDLILVDIKKLSRSSTCLVWYTWSLSS
jgi:hypothetical protein